MSKPLSIAGSMSSADRNKDRKPSSVSAIVVNWNGARVLEECLSSLNGQPGLAETIVVDNGSEDDSASVVARFGARWVSLPRNMGLATAYNEGARLAKGAVLLFLNNDLHIPPGLIAKVAHELQDEAVGAVDVRHRSWSDDRSTHDKTMFEPGPLSALDESVFPEAEASECQQCAYVSGAFFPIRRELFREVGGWDGGFFAGWEDVDLSWRLRLAGFRLNHDPALQIRHRVSASSQHAEGVLARHYAALTGRPRFAIKHAPPLIAVASVMRLVGGIAKDVAHPTRARLRLRAIVVTGKELPRLLLWRFRTYRAAGIAPRQMWFQIRDVSGPQVSQPDDV